MTTIEKFESLVDFQKTYDLSIEVSKILAGFIKSL
jgi:hypothetical protein